MSDRERLRRKNAKRTGPIRDFSGIFDQRDGRAAPVEESSTPTQEHPEGSWQDNVARGAREGYQVIEEHLRHGESVARSLHTRGYEGAGYENGTRLGDAGLGVQEIIENLGRYYTQTLTAYVDLLMPLVQRTAAESPTRSEDDAATTTTAAVDGTASAGASTQDSQTANESVAVTVSVQSERRASTTVHLHSPGSPILYGLQHTNAQATLDELRIIRDHASGDITIDVTIPATAPAGDYHGVVLDRESGQAIGTLSVTVSVGTDP